MSSTEMHNWPELNIPPQVAALAARSMSASERTIIGSLPPSSRLTGGSVSAGGAITLRAGGAGAGELDEVDVVDQGAAGLAGAVHAVEYVGAADLPLPGLDDLG